RTAGADDTILLIEDGVYAALAASEGPAPGAARWCVLMPDARARGLHERLRPDVEAVDHAAFVGLAVDHARVVSWP
ncbi:MAG TPA: sulfurtransferase complex subunit TusB, partial [Pseudomonadales bacterium]|nr:sulfurtransferase complex subunit TusB [Pseudomonadales bacterium]